MARKSTLLDVSKATGLSTFTVSRALSGGSGVSDASREEVVKAARLLGYVPNRAAQALRRASRDTIAVITADTSNSYYLDMLAGLQSVLQPPEWTVIVADIASEGRYSVAVEDKTILRLVESRIAGVISTLTLSSENAKLLTDWDIPLVFVDSAPSVGMEALPRLGTDNHAASLLVGEHLAAHGYKEWLFLAYPARWSTRGDRERGLVEAAVRHGAHLVVAESENDDKAAYAALAAHLDAHRPRPEVVIAGNNPMLLGALHLLRDRGMRVPRDVAVVSFDDFAWAGLLEVPVTVLNEHSERIGQIAGRTLAEIVEGQAENEKAGRPSKPIYHDTYQKLIPAELIVRRSCGCGPRSQLPAPPRSGPRRSAS
jgi:LacI family transcriptional regulator